MHGFNLFRRGRNRRPRAAAGAPLLSAGTPVIEELESRARHRCPVGVPALVEALEPRVQLTATAHIAALANAVVNQNYTVELWTTDVLASSWDINWGDGSTHSSVSNPSNLQVLSATHQYQNTATGLTITAVCTPQVGSNITATFALNSSFGNFPSTDCGATTLTPSGDTGSGTGYAMAIDNFGSATTNANYGKLYVASSYGGKFAVSRFNANGTADNTFGTSGTMNVAVDTSTDTPYSIALGNYQSQSFDDTIAVAGSGQGGFAVALLRYSGGWAWLWHNSNFQSGQANAVAFDQNGNVLAAGSRVPGHVAILVRGAGAT